MFSIYTDLGVIARYADTSITLEAAMERARMYEAQGRVVEIRDDETGETAYLSKDAE
jgi:hypothetical protein